MKVILLSHTPDPERAVAAAAKLCYSPSGIAEVAARLDEEEVAGFLRVLVDMGHHSPLEHASFQFGIEGISRALTHQLVRHRIASYSQQSQRYVSKAQFEYIIPPSIRNRPEAVELFRRQMQDVQDCYDRLLALGVPREDARYCLPNACETRIMISMNARALLHFFEVRCCQRAQWEIRALAYLMLRKVRTVAPNLFAHAGANCVSQGICREGKMSCGRIDRLAKRAGQRER